MYTGLRKAVRVDQPTGRMMKISKKGEECLCTEEPVVDTAIEVPAARPNLDWQKEEPPYYHRDIF